MQTNPILAALDRTPFSGLTIWKVADGYQANLQIEFGGGWSIGFGATASEAIGDIPALGIESALPPPPPIAAILPPPPPFK
jgi:hypothetical protein